MVYTEKDIADTDLCYWGPGRLPIDLGLTLGLGFLSQSVKTRRQTVTLPGRTQQWSLQIDETLSISMIRRSFYESHILNNTFPIISDLSYTYNELSLAKFLPSGGRLLAHDITHDNDSACPKLDMESDLNYRVHGIVAVPVCFDSKHPIIIPALLVDELLPRDPSLLKSIEMVVGYEFTQHTPLTYRPQTVKEREEWINLGYVPANRFLPALPSRLRLRNSVLTTNIATTTLQTQTKRKTGFACLFAPSSGYNLSSGLKPVLLQIQHLSERFLPGSEPAKPSSDALLMCAIWAIHRAVLLREKAGFWFERIVINTTDSIFHRRVTELLYTWESNSWKYTTGPSTGKPVADAHLWKLLLALIRNDTFSWNLISESDNTETKTLSELASQGSYDPTLAADGKEDGEVWERTTDEEREEGALVVTNANSLWMREMDTERVKLRVRPGVQRRTVIWADGRMGGP